MTNDEIIAAGQLIYDETEVAANTSERVGGVIKGIGENLAEKDTAIEAQAARNGYYQCTVSGTTLAVSAPGFTLPAHGGNIRIKMSAPATGACTLNINSTGAKALLYNGAALSSSNTWEKDEIISVFYDGTKYMASNSQGGGGSANKISYDNTESGLDSTNVQDALSEVNLEIKDVSDNVAENLFVYSDVSLGTLLTGYINSSGAWTSGGGHYLVPVSFGETYKIEAAAAGVWYAWLSGTETSGTPSYSDGATKSKKLLQANNPHYVSVPNNNTNYLYICHYMSSTGSYYDPTLFQIQASIKEEVKDIKVANIDLSVDTINDFVISDENNNDIVQFRNGHIYTKYFESDNIAIDGIIKHIKELYQGKKCAIVGDSISTFSGYMPSGYETYYPQGEVSDVSECWWKIVCDVLGMTPVNCAWSGSKVTGAPKGATAAAGCSDQRIADCGRNGNPDIIIFYIGCNDWGNEVSLGTWNVNSAIIDDSEYTPSQTISDFRAAYALMLKKAKLAYPLAKIFCCTILDDVRRDSNVGWPSNNGNGVTTFTWNQSIKEVAEALGASVIDLHSCGLNFFNIVEHSVDVSKGQPAGLHPDIWGHSQMAIKVINSLIGS